MNDHPLCCDCDGCLNGAGGYTLPGAGATTPTPGKAQRLRRGASVDERRSVLVERAHRARQVLDQAHHDLRRLGGALGGEP